MKKIVDFLLGRSDNKEEEKEDEGSNEINDEFREIVYKERPYKFAAAISFFILVFAIGLPLWNHTTSTYRSTFKIPSKNRSFSIPVHIRFSISDQYLEIPIKSLLIEIESNLTSKESVDPLNFEFSTEFLGVSENLNEHENREEFNLNIAVISSEKWDDFSATKIKLGKGTWQFVQYEQNDLKFRQRIVEMIWEVLIDVPHLNSIIRRDLRQKMKPWQIAALPLSHQKRLVWDSAPISMNYHLQIIHLHENDRKIEKNSKKTAEALRQFAKMVKPITNIGITSEHLWDFEISAEFLSKDVQERWVLTHSQMEEMVKKVDSQLQTTLKNGEVLRFVIVESRDEMIILDQFGEDSQGIAIAAWGTVLARNEKTEQRAVAAARIHLGLDAELSSGWSRPPVAVCKWEIERARLRVSVDNAMRALSAIRALHEMTNKITNIVINDEVAAKATKAVELLEDGLKPGKMIDHEKLLEARRLADDANSNHSLLALLYFPMDQRTAVLIPIAVPILFPIGKLLLVLVKKCIFRDFI